MAQSQVKASEIDYLKDKEYCQKLLTAIEAIKLVEIEDPEKSNVSTMTKIKKMCASQILTQESLGLNEIESIPTRHIVCDYSTKESQKRLAVAVTLIQNSKFPVDFYRTIHDFGSLAESTIYNCKEFNYINSTVVYHASKIPVEYLRDKWLKEAYEILFTGYGFGAAIAAFLAMRLLLISNNDFNVKVATEDDKSRILFIGFGCPLFVGLQFKSFIESKHCEKFHFYRHVNDAEVSFRDVQTMIGISTRAWNLQKIEFEKSESASINRKAIDFRELFKMHSNELWDPNSTYFSEYYSKNTNKKFSNCLSNVCNLETIFIKENFYINFGLSFEISIEKIKNVQNWSRSVFNILNDKSSGKLDIHEYIDTEKHLKEQTKSTNLFGNLHSKIDPIKDIKMPPSSDAEQIQYNDFHKKCAENSDFKKFFYTVVVIRKQFEYDVSFGLSCRNMQHVFCAVWKSREKKIISKGLPRSDKNIVWYKFSYPTKMDRDSFEVELNSFYENVCLKGKILKNHRVKINVFEDEVDKTATIYQLEIDVLYIHAIFFIHTIKTLGLKENNQLDQKLVNGSESLIKIFDRMEKIFSSGLAEIPYNEKEKEYVKTMFERYNIVLEQGFINDFKWSEKLEKTFEIIIDNTVKRHVDRENNLIMNLLKDLIPKIYFLKRRQVEKVWKTHIFLDDVTSYYQNNNGILSCTSYTYKRAKWYYHNDIEENHKYEFITSKIAKKLDPNSNSDFEPYLGFFEKVAADYWEKKDGVIETKYSLKQEVVEPLVNNFRIRDTLVQNHVLGVVGLKNVGKSRFVTLITETKEIISGCENETSDISAYRIVNDLIFIDYPHHNSDNPFYRVQFEYSKFLLNYTFVVLEPIQVGKTLTEDQVNQLNDLRVNGMCRFCIVFNKFDVLWVNKKDDYFKMPDFGKKEIERLKDEHYMKIVEKLKEIDEKRNMYLTDKQYKANIKVIAACMDLSHSRFETPTELRHYLSKVNILSGDELKREVLDILVCQIKNANITDRLKVKLDELKHKPKTCRFTYKKKCNLGYVNFDTEIELKQNSSGPDKNKNDVNSFDALKNNLINEFKIDNNSIKIKASSHHIKTYDEFFQLNDFIFEVI